jgi:hypothetical protein
MPTVTSPAAVVSDLGREPLRWVVRVAVRWCGAAPITAVASHSVNTCRAPASNRLINCPLSACGALPTARTGQTRAGSSRGYLSVSSLVGSHRALRSGLFSSGSDTLLDPAPPTYTTCRDSPQSGAGGFSGESPTPTLSMGEATCSEHLHICHDRQVVALSDEVGEHSRRVSAGVARRAIPVRESAVRTRTPAS